MKINVKFIAALLSLALLAALAMPALAEASDGEIAEVYALDESDADACIVDEDGSLCADLVEVVEDDEDDMDEAVVDTDSAAAHADVSVPVMVMMIDGELEAVTCIAGGDAEDEADASEASDALAENPEDTEAEETESADEETEGETSTEEAEAFTEEEAEEAAEEGTEEAAEENEGEADADTAEETEVEDEDEATPDEAAESDDTEGEIAGEEAGEGAEEADGEDIADGAVLEDIPQAVQVEVEVSWQGELQLGSELTMKMVTRGAHDYIPFWEVDRGDGWQRVEDATGETLSFILTVESAGWQWRAGIRPATAGDIA